RNHTLDGSDAPDLPSRAGLATRLALGTRTRAQNTERDDRETHIEPSHSSSENTIEIQAPTVADRPRAWVLVTGSIPNSSAALRPRMRSFCASVSRGLATTSSTHASPAPPSPWGKSMAIISRSAPYRSTTYAIVSFSVVTLAASQKCRRYSGGRCLISSSTPS